MIDAGGRGSGSGMGWSPPSAEARDIHNAKSEYFASLGARVDADGNVTLYHATSAEAARSIRKEGFTPNTDPINGGQIEDVKPRSFFGYDKSWVQNTWGDGTVMQIKVPAYYLHMAGTNTSEVFIEGRVKKNGNIWTSNTTPSSLAWDRRLVKRYKRSKG